MKKKKKPHRTPVEKLSNCNGVNFERMPRASSAIGYLHETPPILLSRNFPHLQLPRPVRAETLLELRLLPFLHLLSLSLPSYRPTGVYLVSNFTPPDDQIFSSFLSDTSSANRH